VDCSQEDTHLNSEQDTHLNSEQDTHLDPEQDADFNFKILTTLKQGSEVIATCTPNTALVITIISGTRFSVAATDAIKAYANNNTPYIKSSAIL